MSAAPPAHLLVVDDDARLRALLRRFLLREGFLVTAAADAARARALLRGLEFDLIVLDVMMPGEDGLSLVRSLRPKLSTPVLLLTARGETADRISGLEAGADDYLAKPFDPRELLLRIHAILRRMPASSPTGPRMLTFGDLRYDIERGELWRGEDWVHLTETESALLRRLADASAEPVSRTELVEDLARQAEAPAAPDMDASDGNEGSERAIDVQITRLRRKLEPDPRQPRFLQTVRGVGYRLVVD